MLNLTSSNQAERLRGFLIESGYTDENLRGTLGLKDLPASRLRNLPRLLDLIREPNCINTLARWFWIGIPEDASAAEKHLPSWFIPLALECGLLYREGSNLCPEAMLFPADKFIYAADHTSKIDTGDPDLVLWPNPTSRLLSRFTVRRPSRATLDLGTGTGIQALIASAHSEKVVATDLNLRAVAFAQFNARLNGIQNVECLAGNGFEPVAGSKFDLIVSNPPFFITPASQYLFCDNPLDLDQLCRQIAREAPTYLNDDGYFQMLCEWAEVSGQPWQERLSEWFEGTGCDVWVMKGYTHTPEEYAQERIRTNVPSPTGDSEIFAKHMSYYRERNVKAIHGGLVAMHRRPGPNWVFIEEIEHTPKANFGDLVMQNFATRDLLLLHGSDDDLLPLKTKLSPDVRMEQVFQRVEDGWQRESLTLRLAKGFKPSVGLQPSVAEFLGGCDGTRPLGEVIASFAAKTDAPLAQVQTECLDVVRQLMERGFLLY